MRPSKVILLSAATVVVGSFLARKLNVRNVPGFSD